MSLLVGEEDLGLNTDREGDALHDGIPDRTCCVKGGRCQYGGDKGQSRCEDGAIDGHVTRRDMVSSGKRRDTRRHNIPSWRYAGGGAGSTSWARSGGGGWRAQVTLGEKREREWCGW